MPLRWRGVVCAQAGEGLLLVGVRYGMGECGVGAGEMQEPSWRIKKGLLGRTADVWESAMVAMALLWASHAVALMRSVWLRDL